MSPSTSAPGNGPTAGKTDLETLKNDMKALRSDLAALLRDTSSLAQDQAKAAPGRVVVTMPVKLKRFQKMLAELVPP